MKRILLLSMVFSFVFATSAWAQRTVSGKVTDEKGEGLPGVNVVIKGTTTGVTTDLDGNYQISVPDDNTVLVYSSVGMSTQEVTVGARSVIEIGMSIDTKELQEIVVTGYSTTTKEKSSVSSVTVSADVINNRPNSSVIQTLSGQIPGLNISTNSGQPGDNSIVNLRGVSSINGDTEPLFIIDGTPVNQDNFRSLNPNEIASISVLKDAGATAIYGNRGANGVIIIETKNGKFNSPLEVTYTFTRSVSRLQSHKYDLMDSQEQLLLEREYGAGRGVGLTDGEIDEYGTTQWLDVFFREAITTNHNLSFSKGGDNTTTFLSVGYMNQDGILKDSGLKRANVRANVTGRSEDQKFNYGLNLSLNYSENDEPTSIGTSGINRNFVLGANLGLPYISPDDYVDSRSLLSPLVFSNTPLFLMDVLRNQTRNEDEAKVVASANFSYEIIDGLVAGVRSGIDYETETRLLSEAPESFNALLFAQTGNTTPGFQDQQYTRQLLYNQLVSLNYQKEIGSNSFNWGVYSEYVKAHFNTFGFRQDGLDPKTFYPGDGSGFVPDNAANDFFDDAANADIATSGLFSYFTSLDWDYSQRFGANVTVRRDASSRFAQSNRWGTFYAVSGRWNIHNEAFASGLPFDVLKLRASYGTNGNQDITGGGPFAALYRTFNFFATGRGYGGANALFLSQIGNSTLKWETVTQTNVAIDAELLDTRLGITLEVYSKTTDDLYLSAPISAINGATTLAANVGSLSNKGFDFNLSYDVFRSPDPKGLNLEAFILGNYNKQEILEFPGGVEEIPSIGRVGGKLYEHYVYRYAGVNPANGNLLFLTAEGDLTENPNPDTDRVWSGKNIFPDWNGSFGLNADYNGFFLTVNFQYSLGVDRFDYDLDAFQDPTSIGQFRSSRDLNRAWTTDNRITDIPALDASNFALGGNSDRYMRSSDYLRLRFVQLGYNVPSQILETVNVRSAKVFVNGENLFTSTPWRGFDAESQRGSTFYNYPTPRTFLIGVEIGF